jgi:hypothetical protein
MRVEEWVLFFTVFVNFSNVRNEMKLECLGTYTTIIIYPMLNSSFGPSLNNQLSCIN